MTFYKTKLDLISNTHSNNFNSKITKKNFIFNVYDCFFESKIKKNNECKKIDENKLESELLKDDEIPYKDNEPYYFEIFFKNSFNILFFHNVLRIKFSINKDTLTWNKYINFIKTENYENKINSKTLEKNDFLKYLIFVKTNILKNNLEFIVENIKSDNSCEMCNETLFVENNNETVCSNCGFVIEKFLITKNEENKEDENMINLKPLIFSSSKIESKDESIINSSEIKKFFKKLEFIEGIQPNLPSNVFIEKVKLFYEQNSLNYLKGKTPDEIKNMEENEKEKYFDIHSLEKIFKEFKQTEYLKDIDYIANKIFGIPLLDLSLHKKQLFDDYIKIEKIKKISLNINIRIIYQLFLIGKNIPKNKIKFVKSKEIINHQLNEFKRISKIFDYDCSLFLKYFDM